MLRCTKIVATPGPATDDSRILDDVIATGVDVVCLNQSHASRSEHEEPTERIRNRSRASSYESPHDELPRGDTLLLDDGLIVLWGEGVLDREMRCKVKIGDILFENKEINKQDAEQHIVVLLNENQGKRGQIQLFRSRSSIVGQARAGSWLFPVSDQYVLNSGYTPN